MMYQFFKTLISDHLVSVRQKRFSKFDQFLEVYELEKSVVKTEKEKGKNTDPHQMSILPVSFLRLSKLNMNDHMDIKYIVYV